MVDKTFTYDGKRYRIRAASEEEWITKKANKIRDIDEGRVILHGSMTVSSWTEVCITTYKTNLAEKGKKAMRGRMKKWVLEDIGSLTLKQVKPLHCQAIMNNLSGMSWSQVDRVYHELRFIFDRAVENELILKSPAENIVKPSADKGHRRAITSKEREHFLKVADQEPRFILFLFMLYCGCRSAEAYGIVGHDITKKDGELILHIRGTKTHNSDRYVPVPDYLAERLPKVDPFEPYCKNKAGKPHDEQSYRRLVKHLYREMNVSMGCRMYRNALVPPFPLADDFVPYDFRHTYCTDLARAGVDIRIAQKLMGHASIKMTADIYTHIESDDVVAAAKTIREYQNAKSSQINNMATSVVNA